MKLVFAAALCVACGSGRAPATAPDPGDALAARFPDARLDDRALCDRLLARTAADYRVTIDPEPRLRRKVIVSDLHLGPGTSDPRFSGIEDFYSETAWTTFLERQAAVGPTDLIIDGDFIEFWQIAAALGVLPKRDSHVQPGTGTVLAEDQDFAVGAVQLVIAAHPTVFRDLGAWIARGDHRVIVIAGNHDADLLWPKVQLVVARAIAPADPTRLLFVAGAAYEHGGVHVEHGHAFDAANRFATGYAPFGRDRDGRCRLQSSWGEIFVDQFYTETERRVPFIDNLYPESAAVLWAMRDNPDPQRDASAVLRFLELLRVGESGAFNRDAAKGMLQSVLGTATGPESLDDVIAHVSDRLVDGDTTMRSIVDAMIHLRYDPELAGLWSAIGRAAVALPDLGAAVRELRAIDPDALAHLHDQAFGDSMQTAATRILADHPSIHVVVLGHTHEVGGLLVPITTHGRSGFYANTGSWISVASVADLRKRGVTWKQLNLADRTMFPSKTTAVVIEYANDQPQRPVVWNAGTVSL